MLVTGAAAYAISHDACPPHTEHAAAATSEPAPAPSDRAVAELAAAVADGADVGRRQARCVAGRLVATVGLDRVVRSGLVSAEGRFLDPDLTALPGLRRSLASAARECR